MFFLYLWRKINLLWIIYIFNLVERSKKYNNYGKKQSNKTSSNEMKRAVKVQVQNQRNGDESMKKKKKVMN